MNLALDMERFSHFDHIANKALRVLHLLYDDFEKVKLIAYVATLCRPKLESTNGIWELTTQTLITKLGNIQINATRFIKTLRGKSVSASSARVLLGIETLQNSRKNKRIEVFYTVFEHESFFPNLVNTLN